MKKLIAFVVLSVLLTIPMAIGAGGGHEGNGGDVCEYRIKTIRDDIASWISKGASSGLSFQSHESLFQYDERMTSALDDAKISCTSEVLKVDGNEKTCKNFTNADGSRQLICNSGQFMGSSEADQYFLVHHEFAGLAGLEVNTASGSDYSISNQVTGFLEDQVIKKLAIKRRPVSRATKYVLLNSNEGDDVREAVAEAVKAHAKWKCLIVRYGTGRKFVSGTGEAVAHDLVKGARVYRSESGQPLVKLEVTYDTTLGPVDGHTFAFISLDDSGKKILKVEQENTHKGLVNTGTIEQPRLKDALVTDAIECTPI